MTSFTSLIGIDQSVLVVPSFTLECGTVLNQVPVAYKTWGQLNERRDNVMIICHAFTGSADVEDWWGPLMGRGKAFDPNRFFIFCANVLGSPYGTASPITINPDTGRTYGPEFPPTTIRDDVRLHKLVLDHLGVHSVAVVIGGSMGGMAVLEWPLCTPPGYVKHVIPLATSARHSAWCISWGEAQRQSIYSDPGYLNGYYQKQPASGLAAARMSALLTYRSRDSFESRFGRKWQSGVGKKAVEGSGGSGGAQQDGGAEAGASAVALLTPPSSPKPTSTLEAADGAYIVHNDGHKNVQPRSPAIPQQEASILSTSLSSSQVTSASRDATPSPSSSSLPLISTVPKIAANTTTTTTTTTTSGTSTPKPPIFSAQSYLRYQGDKFTARFDANCYIHVTRKLDTHDLARGRHLPPPRSETESDALSRVLSTLPPRALVISIATDGLFTPQEQREIAEGIPGAELVVIPSPDGHDGFLLEFEAINRFILGFLRREFGEFYVGEDEKEGEGPEEGFEIKKTSVFGEAEVDVASW